MFSFVRIGITFQREFTLEIWHYTFIYSWNIYHIFCTVVKLVKLAILHKWWYENFLLFAFIPEKDYPTHFVVETRLSDDELPFCIKLNILWKYFSNAWRNILLNSITDTLIKEHHSHNLPNWIIRQRTVEQLLFE